MNAIEDMRLRLTEAFSNKRPLQGLSVSSVFRPTANDMPRLPASNIPNPKTKYDTVGRPPKENKEQSLYRKKPRDIWGGWL